MTTSLPTGTVTFLFTDVEGSTKLWDRFPQSAGPALARHDEIIERAVAEHGGHVVRPRGEGDSRFCVFGRSSDAVEAAFAIQRGLLDEVWPFAEQVRVRIGVHTGEADLRAGDYYGTAVNRCARLRGIAHGGQTLLTRATVETTAGALPTGASLRDLGEHILRDLSHPERVFQLCHPSLPDEFPPLLSLDERRNNLPSELSSFVGREGEVKEVKQLVWTTRLLTLHGAAGCGKTRLALEVADELIGSFADGVWFVDLAPIGEPSVIIEALASALGIHESIRTAGDPESHRGFRERVMDHIRDRTLLIVFDNCEHLVASVAEHIVDILRASPDVRVMVTSREALGVPSEVAWKVPSLSVPSEAESPTFEDLSVYEGCKLFVERARERRPGIWIDADDAKAIASICRRLDGIPLAIELAASRVKLLTPQQIDQRLSERFRLLVGGSRTALERQQTLRATVDWSYEPLGENERALFRRLGVFSGGFTLEAVEAICSDEQVAEVEVLDLLSALVDKSLVESEEHGAGNRYRMLETFRQYAREKLLDAGETSAVRTRHRDFFLGLAEASAREIRQGDQVAWINRLAIEHDNLRGALEWSIAEAGTEGARIAIALSFFWEIRGHATEGRRWCEAALAVSDGLTVQQRSDLLRTKAFLEFESTEMDAAEATIWEWARTIEGLEDPIRQAWLEMVRSMMAMSAGDFVAARRGAESALSAGRRAGDSSLTLDGLWQLSILNSLEGNTDASLASAREMLSMAKAGGDLAAAAASAHHLGMESRRAGDLQVAERWFQECFELSERIDNRARAARSLISLSGIALDRGDTDAARSIIARAKATADGSPALLWKLRSAEVDVQSGDLDAATIAYEQLVESSLPGVRASAHDGLGLLALLTGKPLDALEHLRFGLNGWATVGVRAYIAEPMTRIARTYQALGAHENAVRLMAAADVQRQAVGEAVRPVDRPILDAFGTAARDALGEEAYEREVAMGRALTFEDAVALAMGNTAGE